MVALFLPTTTQPLRPTKRLHLFYRLAEIRSSHHRRITYRLGFSSVSLGKKENYGRSKLREKLRWITTPVVRVDTQDGWAMLLVDRSETITPRVAECGSGCDFTFSFR